MSCCWSGVIQFPNDSRLKDRALEVSRPPEIMKLSLSAMDRRRESANDGIEFCKLGKTSVIRRHVLDIYLDEMVGREWCQEKRDNSHKKTDRTPLATLLMHAHLETFLYLCFDARFFQTLWKQFIYYIIYLFIYIVSIFKRRIYLTKYAYHNMS